MLERNRLIDILQGVQFRGDSGSIHQSLEGILFLLELLDLGSVLLDEGRFCRLDLFKLILVILDVIAQFLIGGRVLD